MSNSTSDHGSSCSNEALDLYSWGAGWGLFSMDPGCLTVQAYLVLVAERFPEAQLETRLTFHECPNPQVSPSGGWHGMAWHGVVSDGGDGVL
jgi:hypothetical protein